MGWGADCLQWVVARSTKADAETSLLKLNAARVLDKNGGEMRRALNSEGAAVVVGADQRLPEL